MAEPVDITPVSAIKELTKLSRLLDDAGQRLHDAERRAVNTKHLFTVERAKAFMAAEGSVQAREAQATIDTADQRISAELAEAELRILKSDIRVLESRLDVGRSVVGVLRAEAQVTR
jgi:hypothetical protein